MPIEGTSIPRAFRSRLIDRIGLELTKAYIKKGWRVIAAVRTPHTMLETEGGEVVVVKLDVGDKKDAKTVCPTSPSDILTVGGRGTQEQRDYPC